VIFVFWIVLGLAVATVHLWRDPQPRSRARTLEIYLLWWLVITLGVGNVVGGLFHVFDGVEVAKEIGFTRGDGGFQFENAMADIAIGTVCILCFWFRGNFWLAALIAVTISWWGDAYGHIYQADVNDNHDVDNTGPVLYSDMFVPLVGLVLYGLFRRAGGGEPVTAPLGIDEVRTQ
jgi:hypothetical protein